MIHYSDFARKKMSGLMEWFYVDCILLFSFLFHADQRRVRLDMSEISSSSLCWTYGKTRRFVDPFQNPMLLHCIHETHCRQPHPKSREAMFSSSFENYVADDQHYVVYHILARQVWHFRTRAIEVVLLFLGFKTSIKIHIKIAIVMLKV